MLELRPVCENCGKKLPADSTEAMICTYECTFCADCVNNILFNICPNCGGGFEKRPIRTKDKLLKNAAKSEPHFKPVDFNKFQLLMSRYKDVAPNER